MEKEKSVYLFCSSFSLADEKSSSLLYNINPNKNQNHSKIDAAASSLFIPPYIPCDATFVTMDSKIYVLGGSVEVKHRYTYNNRYLPVQDVYCMETACSRTNGAWKRCSPMISARNHSSAIVVNGKIYVFGASRSIKPWAEVYDPIADTWLALPAPPLGTELLYSQSIGHSGSKIYLRAQDHELLAYDIKSKVWEILAEPNSYYTQFLVVDETMYLLNNNELYVYDLEKGVMGNVGGLDMHFENLKCYRGGGGEGSLLYIGNGKLCLIGITYCGITCVTFRLIRYHNENGEIFARAQIESSATYDVNADRFRFCFVG